MSRRSAKPAAVSTCSSTTSSGRSLWERVSFLPTCNIAGFNMRLHGPGIKTVLPRGRQRPIDFRLVTDQQPDQIFGPLRDHLDREGFADIELTRIATAIPAKTPLDRPLCPPGHRGRRTSQLARTASIIPLAPPTLPMLAPLHDISR